MIKLDKIEIKPDVYWVGAIDWNLRNFHGYLTKRGTTYNAYLIIDKKVTLIDTVKHYLFEEMIARIKEIIDPQKIDYIVSNHVEMDHSGSILKMIELSKNSEVITSTKGEIGLKKHFKKDLNFKVVNSGDKINIGRRTLHFVHIPMVHWPDSMVTYSDVDKLLFPNDAFGQHIASSERFDDEFEWGILKEEAAKYYANIVMPYGDQVKKALVSLSNLEIDMIAPSHGIIWRKNISNIINEYKKWSNYETENKAIIIYDTMWNSTEKIAFSLSEGIQEAKIPVKIHYLKNSHISEIISDILTSKYILIGSPTLNNTMLPTIGGFITYLKGLKPRNKVGFVFGSYGWGGQAIGEIEETLKRLSWKLPIEGYKINYIPDRKDLIKAKEIGKMLVKN